MKDDLSKTDIDHIERLKHQITDKTKYPIKTLLNMKKQSEQSGTPLQTGRMKVIDLEIASRNKKLSLPLNTTKKTDRELTDKVVAERYLEKLECAARKGIPFDLTIADVRRLLTRKKCHYTGIAFDLSIPQFRPSFDRVDSSKGYTKDNVVVCMVGINDLKNQLLEIDGAFFKGNPDLLLKCVLNFKKSIEAQNK